MSCHQNDCRVRQPRVTEGHEDVWIDCMTVYDVSSNNDRPEQNGQNWNTDGNIDQSVIFFATYNNTYKWVCQILLLQQLHLMIRAMLYTYK